MMLIYILNIVVIFVWHYIVYHSKSSRKIFLKGSLIYLFLVSSFRDKTMGADYFPYISAFNTIRATGKYYMEPGYVLLNKIVAIFTEHYAGIAIATNLLLFIPLYHYIKKYVREENWGLVVFVFAANPYLYIQSTFNAMRQTCAEGIILIGIIFLLKNRNKVKSLVIFIVMVLLAAQFHRISYVLLIIPVITNIRWKKESLAIGFGISVVINVIGASRLLENIVSRLHFGNGYINYEGSILNRPIYIFFIAIVFIYLLYHYDDLSTLDDTSHRLANLYYFSLCFLIVALRNDMIYRVYMMLALIALPGMPVICDSVRVSTKKIRIINEGRVVKSLYVMYYLSFYVGYLYLLAISRNTAYVPFKFCF